PFPWPWSCPGPGGGATKAAEPRASGSPGVATKACLERAFAASADRCASETASVTTRMSVVFMCAPIEACMLHGGYGCRARTHGPGRAGIALARAPRLRACPMPDEVLYVEADGVATITLNRPQARNALTPRCYAQLVAAV